MNDTTDDEEEMDDSEGKNAKKELGMGEDAVPKLCVIRGRHCTRSNNTCRAFSFTPIFDA